MIRGSVFETQNCDAASWNHVLDNRDKFAWARAMWDHKAYAKYLKDKPPALKKGKSVRDWFSRRKSRPYVRLEEESSESDSDLA